MTAIDPVDARTLPTVTLLVLCPPSTPTDRTRKAIQSARLLNAEWEVIVSTSWSASSPDTVGVRTFSPSAMELSTAINEGTSLARGDFVVIIGPDQLPEPEQAERLLVELADRADVDVVYFDDAAHGKIRAFIKPTFSPERLRSQNYWGAVVAYRRTFLTAIGASRADAAGAELYDLALRASHAADVVANSRFQLRPPRRSLEELWNESEAERLSATRSVLEHHLAQTGGGIVESVDRSGIHRTRRTVEGEPLVSIVIPTGGTTAKVRGGRRTMVVEAVREIVAKSSYSNYEFVLVVDTTAPAEVLSALQSIAGDRVRFVNWGHPFSFSGKMNLGVLQARGEYLLLLNDDVELITPDWIESMLALAQRPRAGMVGTMLYFEDDTIQHAGHAYYRLDITHIGLHSERGARGPSGGFLIEREVAGNTAACSMIKRSVFLEAGGFSTLLPGNFNDVDLCMKVSALGYQSYWTPRAELYHYESKSRNPRVSDYEIQVAWGRWEHLFWDSDTWPTDPHEVFRRND